jgi:hypothetical protein
MLRGILTDAVTRQPDLQLVAGEPPPDADLEALRPDVVVCGADDPFEVARPRALLELVPRARVVMVANSGTQAASFKLRPSRLVLREVSMEGLIDTIRQPDSSIDEVWGALRHGPGKTPPPRRSSGLTWREKP